MDDGRSMSVINRSEEDIFASAPSTTVTMSCPPEKVGPLIGKKGIVVQEIMRRSLCRIYVDQNYPEGHPRQIQITGHPKNLGLGIALVTLVMEHGPSIISPSQGQGGESSRDAPETTSAEFLCPSAKVGALIGSKGSNVYEINQRTGCRVQVLQETTLDGNDKKVLLTGNPQQIEEAKALITQLISGGNFEHTSAPSSHFSSHQQQSSISSGSNSRTVECSISPDKVRLVIGAKGVTIGEIMKRSGCKVYINQNFPEGEDHVVVYSGTPQQIDVAKFLVETVIVQGMSALYGILNGTESIVIQEVNIFEPQLARLTAGETVQEIQARSAVKITVDTTPNTEPANTYRVSIIGKVESVHAAIKLIYQAVGSLSSNNAHANEPLDRGSHSSGAILALGKEGTSGHLESAFALADGSHQQVAEINNDVMGRVVGARSATIALIKTKSGANLQVLKADNTKGTTRVVISGSSQGVSLAAQMIQEVLVNGTAKLLKMPDAPVGMKGGSPLLLAPRSDNDGMGFFSHQSSASPAFFNANTVPIFPTVAIAPHVRFHNNILATVF